jgi:hypothetical protein
MLNLISAKLTGTPDESGWSQVHEFTPEDDQKLKLRGHLFALLSTSRGESGIEAVTSGREVISRLHEEYFGDLTAKPFNALQSAIQKVISEFRNEYGDIQIAACAVVDGVVFSSAGGGARVLICRDGSLATILDSSVDVISASGFPKNGDVMMLGTKSFFNTISIGVIKAGLQSSNPEAGAEVFAPGVHGVQNQGGLGAVIIKFEERVESSQAANVPSVRNNTIENVKTAAGSFFSKIIKKLPERRIYIKNGMTDEVTTQSKKLTFTVAIALLAILAVSIGFGIRQKKINDLKSKYQGILRQAQEEVDQAISLSSISPDKSRELFGDSIQKLNEIKALKVKDPKVDELEKKINSSRESILGEYMVPPQLFLDLSLLSSGFKGDVISSSGGSIYILDKNGKRIVSVQISNKKSKVVAGPGVIDEAFDLASYEDRVFVLSGDGIYEIDSSKSKVVEKSWQGEALIKAFAANLYVLDKSGNAIYRYAGSGNTFGEKQNWLAVGTNADFTDAQAWTIDGSMYVLYPNAKILKYSQGSPQAFSLKGVIPDVGSVQAVNADPDNQNIYVLDKAGKRVIVTDKKGAYKAQYIDDQIGNANALVVSETEKKIILLTGDKLYSIDIKNQ